MFVVYWLFGGIYTILDITNRPSALRRYKIQPGTNEPVDRRALFKVIAQVLFNQFVVGLPVVYCSYLLMEWRGYPPMRELPTFHWALAELAIHILFEEIGFYYSHRFYIFLIVNEKPRASSIFHSIEIQLVDGRKLLWHSSLALFSQIHCNFSSEIWRKIWKFVIKRPEFPLILIEYE